MDFAPQSLGVTNPGSTWVKLPQMVGALPWIAPRQFNAIVPAPRAIRGAIKIDSTSVPSAAYTQDVSDLTPALFTAFEDWQPPTVGVSVAGLFAATVINQNLSQLSGSSLTGWPLPRSIRWAHFSGPVSAPIGTYNIDIPLLLAPTVTVSQATQQTLVSGTGGVGHGGTAVLYAQSGGGTGTITLSILDYETSTGANIIALSTPALASGQLAVLRVAPGLPNTPNSSINDLIGLTTRIQIVVAGNPQSWRFVLDLI